LKGGVLASPQVADTLPDDASRLRPYRRHAPV
jgi:hypothetical protein